MRLSYFDDKAVSAKTIATTLKKLSAYRRQVDKIVKDHNHQRPEYALSYAYEPNVEDSLVALKKRYKGIKHLVVVGIGGSNLGVEAVHTALGQQKVRLSVLDTIAPYEIDILLATCSKYKKHTDIAICVISKSGATAETLVNASILLNGLEKRFGRNIYHQTIFIGNARTDLMKQAKRYGAVCVPMPETVGGRFSVTTEVGLIPLALLGHDVDSFIAGVADANATEFEPLIAESASRLCEYIQLGYRHYNFFAFDKRLAQVGAWYRQLFAESLGKAKTKKNKTFTQGMIPTITTAVELHSIGQLYLSGFSGVYTDFVTFDDTQHEHQITKKSVANKYAQFSDQEVATAIYGGVVTAYRENRLPFRTTIFDDDNLAYSLGLFMTMRMREIMYVAELLQLNAFDQPNVESYKNNTRRILGL